MLTSSYYLSFKPQTTSTQHFQGQSLPHFGRNNAQNRNTDTFQHSLTSEPSSEQHWLSHYIWVLLTQPRSITPTPLQLSGNKLTLNEALRRNNLAKFYKTIQDTRSSNPQTLLTRLNAQDYFGLTALHTAIRTRHFPEAKVLLETGVDPFIPDKQGQTALERIAECGETARLDDLLESISPVRREHFADKIAALRKKASENQQRIQPYVTAYQDLPKTEIKSTLYDLAHQKPSTAKEEQILLSKLLALKALHVDLNQYINDFHTAFHSAAGGGGNLRTVRAFLKAGANPDIPGNKVRVEPLFYAIQQGERKIVQALIESGANPDFSRDYYSPIEVAIIRFPQDKRQISILQLLIKSSSNPKQALQKAKDKLNELWRDSVITEKQKTQLSQEIMEKCIIR